MYVKSFRPASALLAIIAILSTAACREEEEPLPGAVDVAVEFGSGVVVIEGATDTVTLGVEVAESQAQLSRGLMQRTSLAPDSGMIFLYEQEQDAQASFWMFDTLIPLSIAFIDANGRIVNIVEMEPCTSPYPQWCRYYEAGVPFSSALEANAGYFEEHGIAIGDRVALSRD
jgi:uncharacterized protein